MLPTNDGLSSGTLYLIFALEAPVLNSNVASGEIFSIGCVAFFIIPMVPSFPMKLYLSWKRAAKSD